MTTFAKGKVASRRFAKGTVTNGRGETEGSGDNIRRKSRWQCLRRARLLAEGETEESGDGGT